MKKTTGLAVRMGTAFFSAIMTPLIFLNVFSWIVGGIWLAVIGQWKLLIAGLILSILMPWVYIIVSLPTLGLTTLAGSFGEKGSKIGFFIFALLGSVYNYAVLSAWCFYILLYFISRMAEGSIIPYLLWAYSTAMAPLGYMASKEPPDSTGTSLGLFYAEIVFVLLSILWIVGTPIKSLMLIAGIMAAIFSVGTTIVAGKAIQKNNPNGMEKEY